MRSLLTRIKTEVTFCLTISWTSQKKDVLSSWGKLGQLIEGQGTSLSSFDSSSGSLGEAKSGDLKSFWDVQESNIVGDSSDNGNDVRVVFGFSLGDCGLVVAEVSGDAGDGDGVAGES